MLAGWGAVIALEIAGLVTFLVGVGTPTTFGWFAYSPLSRDVSTSGGAVVLTRTAWIGAVMLVIGLVGLGFLSGVRTGHRWGTGHR